MMALAIGGRFRICGSGEMVLSFELDRTSFIRYAENSEHKLYI